MRFLVTFVIYVIIKINFVAYNCSAQLIPNGSFEGEPIASTPPPNWYPCNLYSSPDTQPGSWSVTTPASEGNTYISLVTRGEVGSIGDGTVEAIAVNTSKLLLPKTCFKFSVDLAFSREFISEQLIYHAVKLKIYASKAECDKTTLIWTSPVIFHTDWQTYSFSFTLEDAYSGLIFEAGFQAESFHPGNILIDNIQLEAQELDLGKSMIFCEQQKVTLDTRFATSAVLWNNGLTEPSIQADAPGTYWVEVQDSGCILRDTVHLKVLEPLVPLELGEEQVNLCQGDTLILDVASWQGRYLWSTGSDESKLIITQPGTYSLTVDNDCQTVTDDIEVIFREKCCDITAPNVFTPNGDMLNDYFEISSQGDIGMYQLNVYNRWGTLIFNADAVDRSWNGRTANGERVASGVYFWEVRILCNANDKTIDTYKGIIAVVR
jgi:gliding motility-associated-like protein